FHNAPVTKSLLLCIGGCSLVAYLLDSRSLFHLQLIPNLTTNHEFWRLITSHSVLTTSGEFFFGSIIIYHLRIIERQFGSSKYAAFFFVSSALSTILEVGTLAIGRQFHLKFIPAGPYGFIFAALYQYYRMIPYTYQYRVFGINISNRVVNCLSVIPVNLQLILIFIIILTFLNDRILTIIVPCILVPLLSISIFNCR
ncbi:hypothetical protein C1646_633384, partial [Rhizophagus diaphanus]